MKYESYTMVTEKSDICMARGDPRQSKEIRQIRKKEGLASPVYRWGSRPQREYFILMFASIQSNSPVTK